MSTVRLLRGFSAFESALDDFLNTLEMEDRAAATVARYRYAIDRLARFAGKIDPAITMGHLRNGVTERARRLPPRHP